jgi:hypothetical protein
MTPLQFGLAQFTTTAADALQVSRKDSKMKKPLRCLLLFHDWRLRTNDEGQQYKTCAPVRRLS